MVIHAENYKIDLNESEVRSLASALEINLIYNAEKYNRTSEENDQKYRLLRTLYYGLGQPYLYDKAIEKIENIINESNKN